MSGQLTQEELRERIYYDEFTGICTWIRPKGNKIKPGERAGSAATRNCGKRYLIIGLNGKRYNLHRLIFLYMMGRLPKDEIDHINGDGTDNRWKNLREVSFQENKKNIRLGKRNSSGQRGVSYNKLNNKWRARIWDNGKQIEVGSFKNFEDAAKARKEAERKYGFHPNHGQDRPL